jgi:hypothetical protein
MEIKSSFKIAIYLKFSYLDVELREFTIASDCQKLFKITIASYCQLLANKPKILLKLPTVSSSDIFFFFFLFSFF